MMGHCLDKNKCGVAGFYPDLLFYTYDYRYPILIEIGNYNPGKWGEPVIHIGFNLDVTNIGKLSEQAEKVSALLSQHFNT